MSLLPSPPRRRTLFEAIDELADYQHDNRELLTQVVSTHAANAQSNAALAATLGQVQTQMATALAAVAAVHQQIADTLGYWQQNVAGKPVEIAAGGTFRTEVEERVSLAEAEKLSPVMLIQILAPLQRLEVKLADLRLVEEREAREIVLADYAEAVAELDRLVRSHRYLKGLKAEVKALPLAPRLADEDKAAIDDATLEKVSLLHAIAAHAVALYAASQTR